MPVRNRIAEMADEMSEWRRDFHAHPELRFEEQRTAARVSELLRNFGCDEVVEGVGRTGVVGVIRGRRNSSDRVIGFRADMDALPIEEATGLEHASQTPGKMHACGHDGHTAMLLGASKYLCETRNFDGTVVLLFQPAEEGGGGAKQMIADGVIERFDLDEVYAMHNWPGLAVGKFATRPGPFLAAPSGFEITITGKGGHGAMPHLASDPVLAGAHLVTQLQSIVARNLDPVKAGVLSVCGFRSSSDAFNVIPDAVSLRGTVRTMEPEVREMIRDRMTALVQATAEGFDVQAELAFDAVREALVNDLDSTMRAGEAARAVAGEAAVDLDVDPVMGSEDFADFLDVRPGAFLMIGNGSSAGLHNPAYEFNDAAIPFGASFFAELAERRMPLD
ncbi:M20 aminoacylase family protein [Marimonas arenosa]|uniref:M20 family metallopeptidase n=1 Tax=Marimonas arenosa TaxID=1795305 RepID=A0AAE3WGQ5_9RHOB|nr:M20 aminoacylase family protein [Marimonas arenosa]MDQ2091487.1 M20 family metallopeptidase [Marimonas arenosa]